LALFEFGKYEAINGADGPGFILNLRRLLSLDRLKTPELSALLQIDSSR
jgi:hypothetical protein